MKRDISQKNRQVRSEGETRMSSDLTVPVNVLADPHASSVSNAPHKKFYFPPLTVARPLYQQRLCQHGTRWRIHALPYAGHVEVSRQRSSSPVCS